MKLRITSFLLACASSAAWAQLRVLPEPQPVPLFGGRPHSIQIRWQNQDGHVEAKTIVARVLQMSSATTLTIGDFSWKKIQALPGQTILESAPIDFPAVRAKTSFLIQWVEDSHVLGLTEVRVYPTNLLDEIRLLLKGSDLGVLDPTAALQPVLAQNGVPFLDLGGKTLDDFNGKLAIVGPFPSPAQMRPGLSQAIRKLAQRGAAVVWIQPPPEPSAPIMPSFYVVPAGKAVIVVAQADLVAGFSDNPQSQLNLICLCKLALNPAPLPLPDWPAQP